MNDIQTGPIKLISIDIMTRGFALTRPKRNPGTRLYIVPERIIGKKYNAVLIGEALRTSCKLSGEKKRQERKKFRISRATVTCVGQIDTYIRFK